MIRHLGHRLSNARAGHLLLSGAIQAERFELSVLDCAALPIEHQIGDIGAYAAGVRGLGVRLRAIFDRARVRPEALYTNVQTTTGFAAAFFTSEIRELGVVVYAFDGHSIPFALGGPFRLVLPGFHDDRRVIDHLAHIEFAKQPVPDDRVARFAEPQTRNSSQAIYPPAWIAPDPAHPRSGIVPKPVVHPDDPPRA